MADRTGTAGDDTITTGGQDDMIRGLSGADILSASGGDDTVLGGEGGDRIRGGNGDDTLFGFGPADRRAGSGDITATLVTNGLDSTVFLTSAPGDPDRLFVVEKSGQIRIIDAATGNGPATPFLTIPDSEMQDGGEQGLLGLAFHPDYAANGRFFVYLTNADGDIEVREYSRSAGNPDRADPASGDVIMTVPHPENGNHNGGWLAFGPDGYLYIATGDGGSGGDPPNNAQNVDVLLGKMLRVDVDGDDFAGDDGRDYAIPDDNPLVGQNGGDEIWALGLRNPWRNSFDRLTGDLYIGDVGQGEREEINFQPFDSAGGENYGWKVREGLIVFDDGIPGNPDADDPILIDPVIDYPHSGAPDGGFSVTGGYVYRGPEAGMQGVYFYADFVTNQVWSFRVVDGVAVDAANRTEQIVASGGAVDQIASFGEDGRGNLYIIGLDGEIFRLAPGAAAGDGDDRIDGGRGNDRIHGGIGDDVLLGGSGADRIWGDSGADRLTGGRGADTMTGGRGDDVFVFNLRNDDVNERRDAITDFGRGSDLIDLSRLGPGELTFIGQGAIDEPGQVQARQSGDDVVITISLPGFGATEMRITLLDTRISQVTEADFIL